MGETEPTPFGDLYDPKVFRVRLVLAPCAGLLVFLFMWAFHVDEVPTRIVTLTVFACFFLGAILYRLRGSVIRRDQDRLDDMERTASNIWRVISFFTRR